MNAQTQRLAVAGPAGAIECALDVPDAALGAARGIAVICHPHPQHGGTMDNKVVQTLARALLQLRYRTVRFNFRGVGGSAGHYDAGVGELEDALAACAWACAHWRCEVLWLAGFSFGAAVALEAAAVAKPSALVTVAPPVGRIIVAPVARPSCPWLVVQGDRDELVDVATVRRWVAEFALPPQLLEVPGAEHFFHGRLGELRGAVHEFLSAGEGAGV